jgi:hypothetical protein
MHARLPRRTPSPVHAATALHQANSVSSGEYSSGSDGELAVEAPPKVAQSLEAAVNTQLSAPAPDAPVKLRPEGLGLNSVAAVVVQKVYR